MLRYIGKKAISTVISLFFVVTITFFLFELIPGDIYNFEIMHNETYIANIKSKYGLDKPILDKYIITLKNFAHLDFGYSYTNEGLNTNKIIEKGFSVSSIIGIGAIILSTIIGLVLGVIISYIKNKKIKAFSLSISLAVMSIPAFVSGVVLQYILCVKLHLFSTMWNGSVFDMILPIIVLSIVPSIYIMRTINSSLEKEKEEDYIIAIRTRGVKYYLIKYKYMLKNCLTPIISYLGQLTAGLLVGSFVIETIFNIPGLGRYFVTSINNRDYPLVMGLTVFYSAILIVTNFLADIMVCIVNPQIKERLENG